MRLPMLISGAALLILSATPGVVAQHDSHAKEGGPALRIGKVVFPNSGRAAAQEPFLRGIALLHSYEYYDARMAFQQAQAADRAFALPYWLEAFTHSQFDWGVEDLAKAQEALLRLAGTQEERLARAGNARERAFGAAIESFLDGTGSPIDRAHAFAAAMGEWYAAVPSDPEAAAFAARGALYVLRYAPAAERMQAVEEAIARAERVVAGSPQHPGGIHYLIHATDSPRFAARGLAAARIYDKLAPDADHALHMPSHIYLQLGMWTDVTASNERAWAASRAWVARGGHTPTEVSWHSLQWLQYSYLQQGRYRQAHALIDTARTILATASADMLTGYPDARYAVEMLEFQYAAETGDWTHVSGNAGDAAGFAARAVDAPSVRERQEALWAAYHVVAAAIGRRDPETASKALESLRPAVASAAAADPRRTLFGQLEALLAGLRGDPAEAIDAMTRLAGSQRDTGLTPVGPPPALPVVETLAAALLEARRFADAAAAYERALVARPNRTCALLGLARAKKAAGDTAGAAAAYARVAANWKDADPRLPALAEVRARH